MGDLVDLARQVLEQGFGEGQSLQGHQVSRIALTVGSRIWWRAANGRMEGPAVVEQVTQCEGREWGWVTYQGMGRWSNRVVLTRIEPHQAATDTDGRR